MPQITERQKQIIAIIKRNGTATVSDIFTQFSDYSERTLKRELSELVKLKVVETIGGGRSTRYQCTILGHLFFPLDGATYALSEPEDRVGALTAYQFKVWPQIPARLFATKTYQEFTELTSAYQAAVAAQSEDVRKRELERFIIELSWKSSKIEGNTYTLLDTERLLKDGIPAAKNSAAETQMILNHKRGFDFIMQNPLPQGELHKGYVETLHAHLMKDLLHDMSWRKSGVGITGSTYRPLDNQFQIMEAIDELVVVINRLDTAYDKALMCLCGVSYIQPFVDGNKRTARLLANALLLAGNAAPLSYRNVDEVGYRSSLLAFYEQLSIIPMQDIFIDQYKFAATQYR